MIDAIHLAKILTTDDTGLFPTVKSDFFGKTQTLKKLGMYGISSNPPDDSFGVALRANRDSANNIFAVVDRPDIRFKNLAKGEFKIGNYLTQDSILFKADATIEITALLTNVFGDLTISGDSSAADHFSGIVSGLTHTHTGVTTGGGVSGPPVGGGGGPAVVLSIVDGGTGESTAQDAIDALSAVSGATNEHVLTKDTASGNALWKPSVGAGETNTASNVGTDGLGVFKQKSGVDLEFKNIAPASAKISVVANGDDIDLDVVQSAIIHTNITAGSGADHSLVVAVVAAAALNTTHRSSNGTDHSLLGATPGTAAASLAVILDASKNIAGLGTIGCGAITSTGTFTLTGMIDATHTGAHQLITDVASSGASRNVLFLDRAVGATIQAGDAVGIRFSLMTTTPSTVSLGAIQAIDISAGSGDGELRLRSANGGTLIDAVIIDENQDVQMLGNMQVDGTLNVNSTVTSGGPFTALGTANLQGALNHDGSTAGFYSATPVTQAAGLTAADATATDGTDATQDQLINNMRIRINELEAGLDATTGVGLFV